MKPENNDDGYSAFTKQLLNKALSIIYVYMINVISFQTINIRVLKEQ